MIDEIVIRIYPSKWGLLYLPPCQGQWSPSLWGKLNLVSSVKCTPSTCPSLNICQIYIERLVAIFLRTHPFLTSGSVWIVETGEKLIVYNHTSLSLFKNDIFMYDMTYVCNASSITYPAVFVRAQRRSLHVRASEGEEEDSSHSASHHRIVILYDLCSVNNVNIQCVVENTATGKRTVFVKNLSSFMSHQSLRGKRKG